jgi:hypothetical protein
MNYSVDFNPVRPLEDKEMEKSRNFLYIHTKNIPGSDRAQQNKDNDYLIDREAQASGRSYTGITGLGIQDCGIQESMGPIADRTIEHLGVSDTIIIKLRRLLLDTLKDMEAGRKLPGMDPASWQVRSARFKLAKGRAFLPAIEDAVRIRASVAAK